MTMSALYSMPDRLIVSHGPDRRSHHTEGDHLLCDPARSIEYSTQTLDLEATCGWCRLIEAYKEGQ